MLRRKWWQPIQGAALNLSRQTFPGVRRHHHTSRLVPLPNWGMMGLVLVCMTTLCIIVALLLLFD
jgi:hypothetical protein